jgi:hypothetical protein
LLRADGLLAPKMLFPWLRPTRSEQLQVFTLSAALPSAIRFEDIAQKAGVHFVTENCPTPEKHQPETMPAGIALFDYCCATLTIQLVQTIGHARRPSRNT